MYIQMLTTRVKIVKQIHSSYKCTCYIITLTTKSWKLNEDLLVSITTHFKNKK